MEFKTGDRVHVMKLDGEKVDFYATLSYFDSFLKTAYLVNCTDKSYEKEGVYWPICEDFGPNKNDYYTLATDEEDTEDMEIKGLVELGNDGDGTDFFRCNGSSINEQKDFDSEAFYILNDDLTMTLIWTQEKGLVE